MSERRPPVYEPEPLCHCGHRRAAHVHWRQNGRPVDCGQCGLPADGTTGVGCTLFTPRSRPPFNEAQRRAGVIADQQMLRSFVALSSFALSTTTPPPRLPIPAQRPPEDPPRPRAQSFTTAYREAITGKRRRR